MKKILVFIMPVLLFFACGKGPETVTVNTDPSELFGRNDTTYDQDASEFDDDFMHLKLGEIAPIESLDPLYAESSSEFRILNLLYEGLTQLDDNGQLAPALARSWDVNMDSTQITFHLQTEVFFHDAPVFDNGNGRPLTADDVKYVFERMTSNNVPEFTGQLYMNIRGFSELYNERKYVKDPAKRVIENIEGITVRNDSTLIFKLDKKIPGILKKLAHPRASVYARESVPEDRTPIQASAGTGDFYFVKKEENIHILAASEKFKESGNIDRLDFISGLPEKDLFQQFAKEELDVLLEVPPATLATIADSTGNLMQQMYEDYVLTKTDTYSEYPLYTNQHMRIDSALNIFLQDFSNEFAAQSSHLGNIQYYPKDTSTNYTRNGNGDERDMTLEFTQTTHPVITHLIENLSSNITSFGYSVSMKASFALSDDVTFTTRPYHDTYKLISWNYPVYILTRNTLTGISLDQSSWKLDLTSVQVKGGNQ